MIPVHPDAIGIALAILILLAVARAPRYAAWNRCLPLTHDWSDGTDPHGPPAGYCWDCGAKRRGVGARAPTDNALRDELSEPDYWITDDYCRNGHRSPADRFVASPYGLPERPE